eukprot:2932109-Rhodomonas_salina.1
MSKACGSMPKARARHLPVCVRRRSQTASCPPASEARRWMASRWGHGDDDSDEGACRTRTVEVGETLPPNAVPVAQTRTIVRHGPIPDWLTGHNLGDARGATPVRAPPTSESALMMH